MERGTSELGAMVVYEQHLVRSMAVCSSIQPFETCSLEQFCKSCLIMILVIFDHFTNFCDVFKLL